MMTIRQTLVHMALTVAIAAGKTSAAKEPQDHAGEQPTSNPEGLEIYLYDNGQGGSRIPIGPLQPDEPATKSLPLPSLGPDGSEARMTVFDPENDRRPDASDQIHESRFSSTLSLGYRRDDLDFNIAGVTGTPNIVSELQWKDIDIAEARLSFHWHETESWLWFQGSVGFGWILDGRSQDSDYFGSNRTGEFSRSYSNVKGDGTADFSLALGYSMTLGGGDHARMRLTPLLGYSRHDQNLRNKDGVQTISEEVPEWEIEAAPLGPLKGLNSTYKTRWHGPWLGLNAQIPLLRHMRLDAEFGYHRADFYAQANWNLRSDLQHPVSFEHEADGSGYHLSLGLQYQTERNWSVQLGLEWQHWETDRGDNTFYFDDLENKVKSRLNETNWDSLALRLGLDYHF